LARHLKIYFSTFFFSKKQPSHSSRNQKMARHLKIMAFYFNRLFLSYSYENQNLPHHLLNVKYYYILINPQSQVFKKSYIKLPPPPQLILKEKTTYIYIGSNEF